MGRLIVRLIGCVCERDRVHVCVCARESDWLIACVLGGVRVRVVA